jgi:hypothetical protein
MFPGEEESERKRCRGGDERPDLDGTEGTERQRQEDRAGYAMSLSGVLQAKLTKWPTREARLEARESQDEDMGREPPLETATRVGENRASEVGER